MNLAQTSPTSQPLRVLMLAPAVGLGGADTGIVDWCATAASAGITPYLLTTQYGQDNSRFEDAAKHCAVGRPLAPNMRPADMPGEIMSFLAQHHIDVVHVMNSKLGFDLLPFLRSQMPVVVQFHNEERSGRGYPRHVASRFDEWVSAYSVISTDMANSLERHAVRPEKIHRILLGVDTEHFATLTSARNQHRVLWAGRLTYQKRPELLIEIGEALRDRSATVSIDIVGGGEQFDALERAIAEANLGAHLRMHGDQHDLRPYYERAGQVLLTSRYEGIPKVIYEAMASARPVISPKVGGVAELLTADCGVLLDPAASAAEYCDAILELHHNPDLRAQLGASGRARVEAIGTTQQSAIAHAELYRSLVGEQRTPTLLPLSRAGVAADAVAVLLTETPAGLHLRRADRVPNGEQPVVLVGFSARGSHGDSVELCADNGDSSGSLGFATHVPLPCSMEWNEALAFAHWRAEQVAGRPRTPARCEPIRSAEPAYLDHPMLGAGAPATAAPVTGAMGAARDLRLTVLVSPTDPVAALYARAVTAAARTDGIAVECVAELQSARSPIGGLLVIGEHPMLDPSATEDHPLLGAMAFLGLGPVDTPFMNRARPRLGVMLQRFHIDPAEIAEWAKQDLAAELFACDVRAAADPSNAVAKDLDAVVIGELSHHRGVELARALHANADREWHIAIRDTSIAGLAPQPLIPHAHSLALLLARTRQLFFVPWGPDRVGDRSLMDLAEAHGVELVHLSSSAAPANGSTDSDSSSSLADQEESAARLRATLERSTAQREAVLARTAPAHWSADPAPAPPAPPPPTTTPKKQLRMKRTALEQRIAERCNAPERPEQHTRVGSSPAPADVAVAITAHGASTTIMDALESVVHATSDAAHVEVLIDTDGDHETWQQIAHALDQLPSDRFTWTAIDPGRNTGLAAARNRLLERVTAPRVLFLDGDDLLEPAVLTHLTHALNRDPSACFAYGLVTLFGTQSGIANRVPWDPDRLVHGNYIAATALFNTAALRDLGGYDPDMNDRFGGWEDYELWCRIAATGGRGVYLPRPTLRYRQHDHSMVTTMGLDVWSAVAHLQHLHPSLPWPYHLAEDTNAEAVPVLGKTSRRVGMGRLRGLIRRGR